MKKILAILLTVCLLITAMPFTVYAADAPSVTTGQTYTGTSGSCQYSFDTSTHVLTISGNGRMADYTSFQKAPWESCENAFTGITIDTVIIEEGVTYLGNYAFYNCSHIGKMYFPDSLTTAGSYVMPQKPSAQSIVRKIMLRENKDHSFLSPLYNNIQGWEFVANHGTTGDCTWQLSVPDDKVLTISGTGATANYSSNEYSGTYSPWGKSITEVIVEDGVTGIGEGAFFDCGYLKKVTLGETVQSIGFGAFRYCTALTSIIIPESTTVIKNYAFYGCSSLLSVYVLNANCQYDKGNISNEHFTNHNQNLTLYSYSPSTTKTYAYNNSIKFVGELPYGRTGECRWALEGRKLTITGAGRMGDYSSANRAPWGTDIYEVVLSDGVTNVGSYSFYQCTFLTSVTMPDTVTEIGHDAFVSCPFSRLPLPAHLETIGSQAFARCINYTDLQIPDSVTEIGSSAFIGCRNVKSLSFPPNLTTLSYSVFADCSGLSSVFIPATITSIGSTPFYGCTGLTSVTVDQANPVYDSRENCNAIIETESNKLISGCKVSVIPDSVTDIADFAFYRTGSAGRIVVPGSIKTIEHDAFRESGFTEIILSKGTESIGYQAFRDCGYLQNIYIPDTVTSFGNNAFADCPNLTVCGETGSAIETFAKNNNISFAPMGDSNRDNKVSISDVTAVQRHLAEIEDAASTFAADVNFDNEVTISDATYVQQKLAEFF